MCEHEFESFGKIAMHSVKTSKKREYIICKHCLKTRREIDLEAKLEAAKERIVEMESTFTDGNGHVYTQLTAKEHHELVGKWYKTTDELSKLRREISELRRGEGRGE